MLPANSLPTELSEKPPLRKAQSRTLIIANASKGVGQQDSVSLLVGLQSGTAALEDSSVFSYKLITRVQFDLPVMLLTSTQKPAFIDALFIK